MVPLAGLLLVAIGLLGQRGADANPTMGKIRGLVVLVHFPDHAMDRSVPSRDYLQHLCDSKITDYLYQQSYGLYDLTCDVQEWKFTNDTEASYAAGVGNFKSAERSADFAHPVLDALDAEGLDWSKYDSDGDGEIDAILFLHSGYARERGLDDSCAGGMVDPDDRLQSMAGPVSDRAWETPDGEYFLGGYAIASAFDTTCSDRPAAMGVMTHEWLHTLYAIDLYDPSKLRGGLGHFDIMSNPLGAVSNQLPGSPSVYSKILVGWITPKVVSCDGIYELRTSNLYPDALVISAGFGPNEYLLLENRQLINYDAQLPGGGGILIYKVDEEIPGQTTPGWPGSSFYPMDHYKVALLQADGNYDLERGVNSGDAGDYYDESRSLRPGTYGFFPNSDSYQFGILASTGITVSDISKSNITMTLRVSGLGTCPTPTPTSENFVPPIQFEATPPALDASSVTRIWCMAALLLALVL